MTHLSNVSDFAAAAAAVLVVSGAALALVGSLGLVRLKTFYERVHPPTMGTTLGAALVLCASMILFTSAQSRPVVHEILIGVFMIVTTPVTFMLLVRAALHREHANEGAAAPAKAIEPGGEEALRLLLAAFARGAPAHESDLLLSQLEAQGYVYRNAGGHVRPTEAGEALLGAKPRVS